MKTATSSATYTTGRRASTDNIETVTARNFEQRVLHAQGPVVVEFMSYGCAHCRMMEPVLQKVAEAVKSRTQIFRVNVGADPRLADAYGIEGTPTFVMFESGREIARLEGPRPEYSSVLAAVTRPFES